MQRFEIDPKIAAIDPERVYERRQAGLERTRRVELRISPRPGEAGGRDWAVNVHAPPGPDPPPASAYFVVGDDGNGPVEVAPRSRDDPAAGAVRPLAEEAVRQVRGLGLF